MCSIDTLKKASLILDEKEKLERNKKKMEHFSAAFVRVYLSYGKWPVKLQEVECEFDLERDEVENLINKKLNKANAQLRELGVAF